MLKAYISNLLQKPHSHDAASVSLVLAGSLREESGGKEAIAGPGMFALRPAGFGHQVRYGRTGTLIVSLHADPDELRQIDRALLSRWSFAPNPLVANLLGACASGGPPSAVSDALWDAVASDSGGTTSCKPPVWLATARDRLIEEPASIATVAAEAGVHRIHFSRAFTRAFGFAPSIYRRRMQALRAAQRALSGKAAADTAYGCGFADQSHMSRTLRETTGMSFGDLRRLGEQVTSIQE